MSKRPLKLYWDDISTALNNIERYTRAVSFLHFTEDQKTIDAVIRNLEIIGEAATHIPSATRAKYPSIPWGDIIGMRNKIIHEYSGVDLTIVWKTIEEDLPELKKQIQQIRKRAS